MFALFSVFMWKFIVGVVYPIVFDGCGFGVILEMMHATVT
jgi:hypothetical protein